MAFLNTIQQQRTKLVNTEFINLFWRDIIGNEVEQNELRDKLFEYAFHLPLDLEVYFKTLLQQIEDVDQMELRSIDNYLNAYMLTFIYFCTLDDNNHVSLDVNLLASQLYMKLILNSNIFYHRTIYKNVLKVQISAAKSRKNHISIEQIINAIESYVTNHEVRDSTICDTISVLNKIIVFSTKGVINFSEDEDLLDRKAFSCIETIVKNEKEPHRLIPIYRAILKPLEQEFCSTISSSQRETVLMNLNKFIQKLCKTFDEDAFNCFISAFCSIWGDPYIDAYEYAVTIINDLPVQYYKELLRKLGLMLQTKNQKKILPDLFRFFYLMLCNLPTYIETGKLDVMFECALRNTILHVISPEKTISQKAIESLTKICLLNNNGVVTAALKSITKKYEHDFLDIDCMLRAFNSIIDTKWISCAKNRDLTIITCVLLLRSDKYDTKLAKQVLHALCWEATPFSIKPCIQLLLELYVTSKLKNQPVITRQAMNILLRMALHNDPASVDFLRVLYYCFLKPSRINNLEYNTDFFTYLFFKEFRTSLFFTKCHQRDIIREEHITELMESVLSINTGKLRLLCSLLTHYRYIHLSEFAQVLVQNLESIIETRKCKYILQIFILILKWKTDIKWDYQEFPKLNYIYVTIKTSLLSKCFSMDCIQTAYILHGQLADILGINQTEFQNELNTSCILKLTHLLRNNSIDVKTVMYTTEYVLHTANSLDNNFVDTFYRKMMDENFIKDVKINQPQLWPALLTLMSTVAMKDKRTMEGLLDIVKKELRASNNVYKATAIEIYNSVCIEIVHDFDEIINFCFNEFMKDNACLIRICASIVEKLVHEDFLILDGRNYFKFISLLGIPDFNIYMRELLSQRFVQSSRCIITKHFVSFMVYANQFKHHPHYIITNLFEAELNFICPKMTSVKDVYVFLFHSLPVKSQFDILNEIATFFDEITKGKRKVDETFLSLLTDFISLFKYITSSQSNSPRHEFYSKVCKQVKKQIIKKDSSYNEKPNYLDYEEQLRHITLILLRFLFHNENNFLFRYIQASLFDTIIHWIDFLKPEIVHYVHLEKGTDFGNYFEKLIDYHKINKNNLSFNQQHIQ